VKYRIDRKLKNGERIKTVEVNGCPLSKVIIQSWKEEKEELGEAVATGNSPEKEKDPPVGYSGYQFGKSQKASLRIKIKK
jgi:hypothetical protein